ncbi:MAG: DUF2218 domain-containing protein [Sphingomonadales bacterium]|nr:DUF2218 domain-containing protein [Sphingomonadales bacterium]
MIVSRAVAPTAHASRYLQQLCKHWSHKFEVSFDPEQGRVALPSGVVELAAAADSLTVTCTVERQEQQARIQDVVADHVNRFAFREGALVFDWKSA